MPRIPRLLYIVASILFAGTLVISAQAQPSAKNGRQPTTLGGARDVIIRTIGAEKDTVRSLFWAQIFKKFPVIGIGDRFRQTASATKLFRHLATQND